MNRIVLFAICTICGLAAFADRTAKAVFNSETLKLEFYYDGLDHSGDNVTVYSIDESGARTWAGASSVTQVVFDVSFKDFKPRSLQSWFSWQASSLTEIIGFENLDTSEVTSMHSMFRYIPVKVLDLSHFDWQKVTTVNSMLNSCDKLTTVYVAPDYALRSDISSDSPFGYTYAIVGGQGTTYNQGNIGSGIELARIDGGFDSETPGYFTEKVIELPPAIYSITQKQCTEDSFTMEIRGRFYTASGTISAELKKDGVAVEKLDLSAYGDVVFDELEPSTTYSVVVSSKNDYGTTVDDSFSFTTLDPLSKRWCYNKTAGVVSNSLWRFGASVTKNTTDMTISTVQSWPDEPSALDFSKQVVDADGVVYNIKTLAPAFGESTPASGWYPVGKSPQCARVGELALPKRLVTISGCAFTYCTNMTLKGGFPGTLDKIDDAAFSCAVLSGEAILTNVSYFGHSAFRYTDIESVVFGPKLTFINENYNRNSFQGCTKLTNVTFHADSNWHTTYGGTFSGCSALKEVNLQGMTNAPVSIVSGSGIQKLTFSAKMRCIKADAFTSGSSLTTVVFEGAPPVSMDTPLYSKLSNTKMITTYVPYKLLAVSNSADKCWLDYAANGTIGKRNTTWASDYTGSAEVSKRPLLTIPPPSFMILIR